MTIDPAQVIDPAPGSFYAPEVPTVIPADPTPAPAPAAPAAGQQTPPSAPQAAPVDADEAAELPTGMEVLDSLTHFDEIAIKAAFRTSFAAMDDDEMAQLRALYFVLLRRGWADDENARRTATSSTWGEVKSKFRRGAAAGDDADEVSRPEA